AAGEGTRMRSSIPKVLHRIAGRTLIGHAVRAADGMRPDHLVVVVGHGRKAVAEHLDELAADLDRPVTTAVQEEQRGTGHAVSCVLTALPEQLTGTVLVSYGDVPLLEADTLRALYAEHVEGGNAVTVLTAVVANPTGYGRIVRQVEGVNDRVQLANLGAEFNRRLVHRWMRAGVTVIDPATTWLDMDVRLARDVLLEPGVQLRGRTSIGEGAVVGPDSTLTDVTVETGASVVRTHGSGAWIGPNATVGPFAYL